MKSLNDKSVEMPIAIRPFLRAVEVSPDEQSIERALKLALRRLPENVRLSFFAHAITSPLPHAAKAALWRVIRYSHFWWNVDALLQGDVMGNPVVQRAFADAVAMRRWTVLHHRPGWEYARATLSGKELDGLAPATRGATKREVLIFLIVHWSDTDLANVIRERFSEDVPAFADVRGNGILWYLTYRTDQQVDGGFACPQTAGTLISLGADPCLENELGLCWNDVSRHFVR
jgi:hypothetical protein